MWVTTTRTSVIIGLLLGTLFGLEVAGMGDLLPYPLDTFLFISAFSALSVISSGIAFSIVCLILQVVLVGAKSSEQRIQAIVRTIGIFLVIYSQMLLIFFEINRPVDLASLGVIFGMFVLGAVSVYVSHKLQKLLFESDKIWILRKIRDFMRRPLVWFPIYFVMLMTITVSVSFCVTRTPFNTKPLEKIVAKGKILFFGVDAADWDTLLPLIEAGRLPNIARLVKEGSSGKLPSLITTWGPLADSITYGIHSPAVWTSILTGKSPFRHGIKDFFYTEIPNIEHPFRYRLLPSFVPSRERVEKLLALKVRPPNRFFRKCKAAWNILTDVGLQVGVLGWWITWPAEEVNGHLLSDRFIDPNLPERWFPENLVDQTEVNALLTQMSNPPTEDLQYFTQFEYDPKFRENFDPESREYMRNDLMTNLVNNFYPDKFRSQLGRKLLSQHDYALLAIYFYGTDPAGHAFTRFKYPDLFLDVEPNEVDYFGKIIDKYYMWVDAEIGKYLEIIDQDTTVILCSDHGLGPWLKVSSVEKGVRLSGSHRRNGIAIFYGNHIRKGVEIFPTNVLDVLPTVLYLIGLPVAQDMDGTIIKDAIDPQHLASSPPKTIKTFETERYEYSRMKLRSKQSLDAGEIERLRSLGYMN